MTPGLAIQYIALNTERPLFKDKSVRQAVAYAIDRTFMMRTRRPQRWHPERPAPAAGHPRLPADHDLSQHAEHREGEATDARSHREGDPLFGNDPISKAQSERIQHDLKQIGIEVDIKIYSFGVQITKAGTRGEPFDMNLIGWFADYPDPYDFINVLLRSDGDGLEAELSEQRSGASSPASACSRIAAWSWTSAVRYWPCVMPRAPAAARNRIAMSRGTRRSMMSSVLLALDRARVLGAGEDPVALPGGGGKPGDSGIVKGSGCSSSGTQSMMSRIAHAVNVPVAVRRHRQGGTPDARVSCLLSAEQDDVEAAPRVRVRRAARPFEEMNSRTFWLFVITSGDWLRVMSMSSVP